MARSIQYQVNSSLPKDDLSKRLADALKPSGALEPNVRLPQTFVGTTNERMIRIQCTHSTMNSFRPIFEGHIRETDTGSEIVGEFKHDGAVRGISWVMTGFGVVAVVGTSLTAVAATETDPVAGVMAFGVGLALLGMGALVRRAPFVGEDLQSLKSFLTYVAEGD